MLFYLHNGRGTEARHTRHQEARLKLILGPSQTRQGRIVTVTCQCISRPLTWATPWQGGRGGRNRGAEAQMPPDVPTQCPKAAGSDRPRQNGSGTEGIWLVTTIWRPRAVRMPRQNCDTLHPSSVHGLCQHCIVCVLLFVGPDLSTS